eukprot:TRINITY_DN14420_c0_g1_i1.p1 TRINITY_DN14420_c0_g1~~TRINITY_DN14420_c0_g1_i1.p1  ORF type:complete len:103 (+),score=1.78 TRINITY_DN14420_c0_g1_i1:336-644(+)
MYLVSRCYFLNLQRINFFILNTGCMNLEGTLSVNLDYIPEDQDNQTITLQSICTNATINLKVETHVTDNVMCRNITAFISEDSGTLSVKIQTVKNQYLGGSI